MIECRAEHRFRPQQQGQHTPELAGSGKGSYTVEHVILKWVCFVKVLN